jgi:hypothetical protein
MTAQTWHGARVLTAEERAAFGWPEEPAGVDTIRTPATAVADTYGRWEKGPDGQYQHSAPRGFYPRGPVTVETAEGGASVEHLYLHRGGALDTEEQAVEKGNRQALKQVAASRRHWEIADRWDAVATRMAAGNKRGRIGEGWTLEDHHRPIVGEHVRIWAHGGYRTAVVVETTKGRGVTVVYATPSSPLDVHQTKTTKYAVSTGARPISMG